MTRSPMRHAALAGLLLLAACSANPASGRSGPVDRNRISQAEIQEALSRNITNAYDLVMATRNEWLRRYVTGLGGSAAMIAVFENNNRLGGLEMLRNVPLANAEYIRLLSPSEAGGMFGLDVNHGAIQIVTRTGR